MMKFTFTALQKTHMNFFYGFAWGFGIENGRDSGEFSVVSVSHEKKHDKSLINLFHVKTCQREFTIYNSAPLSFSTCFAAL